MEGLGCRVEDLGLRVWNLGFRGNSELGSSEKGLGLRVQDLAMYSKYVLVIRFPYSCY